MYKQKSILEKLSDKDLEEVFSDYKLSQNDYDFYFILDADELREYCMPLEVDNMKNLGVISDEQFIVEYLFHEKSGSVIFLDEYIDELDATRAFLDGTLNMHQNKELASRYSDELINLIYDLKENFDNKDDYFEEILTAYSFLQSISSGSFKKSLKRYMQLMSQSVLFEGNIKDQIIDNLLNSYKVNIEVLENIQEFLDDKSKSRENDIRALLKTFYLNNSIFNSYPEKKKIFYFISSRTSDIREIKKELISEKRDSIFDDETFELKNVNSIIRSKGQLFAFLVYSLTDKSEKEGIQDVLNRFNEKSMSYELIHSSENGRQKLLKELINDSKLSHDREIIENITVFDFKKSWEEAVLEIRNFEKLLRNANDGDTFKQISQLVKEVIDIANNVLVKQSGTQKEIKSFINPLNRELSIVENFTNYIHENKNNELRLDRGSDPIESTFSAFPILFEFPFFKEQIFPIFLATESEKITMSQEIYNLTTEVYKDFQNNLFAKTLYMLLLVKYQDPFRHYSSNFIVYSYIRDLVNDNMDSFDYHFPNGQLADFLVMGCWAARRSRKYKLSYELSMLGLKRFPKDPRFDFSLALTGYCWKYEYDTLERYEWSYQETFVDESGNKKKYYDLNQGRNVLHWCKRARNKCDFSDSSWRENESKYHLYNSILNLEAFIHTIVYKMEFENIISESEDMKEVKKALKKSKRGQKSLNIARNQIEELKNNLEEIKRKHKSSSNFKFPEYTHSEIFLSYYEILNKKWLEESYDYKEDKRSAIRSTRDIIRRFKNRGGLRKRCQKLLKDLKSI